MGIVLKCPRCRRTLEADEFASDMQVPCVVCGSVMRPATAQQLAKPHSSRLTRGWQISVLVGSLVVIGLGWFAWREWQRRDLAIDRANGQLDPDVATELNQRAASAILLPVLRQRIQAQASEHVDVLSTTASTIINGPEKLSQEGKDALEKSRRIMLGLSMVKRAIETEDYRCLQISLLSKLPLPEGGFLVLLQVDLVRPSTDASEATIARRFFIKYRCVKTDMWHAWDPTLDRDEPLSGGEW